MSEKQKKLEYLTALEEKRGNLKRKNYEIDNKIKESKLGAEKDKIEQEIGNVEEKIDEIKPKRARTYGDPIVELND